MKHIKTKIFSASVASLAVLPLLSSCVPANIVKVNSKETLYTNYNGESESNHEACTVTYVGKEVSESGLPIAARATDCNPKAVHLKLKHYKANELANKTVVGKLGMSYTFPATTLAYTSNPLSDKTSSDPTWASGMWENNGINEMGVGVSATLTCTANHKIAVRYTDDRPCIPSEKFIKAGVGEELLPMIMAAQATSARNAMEIAAKTIDDIGAQDSNIIFAVDQHEAWLMEIYSKQQYCAVKLPDDKAFVAGNEFILDSLHDLGINASNKDQLCITSKGLLDVPKQYGYDRYIAGTSEADKDIYHLDLFNTYADEGTCANDGTNVFSPRCHMRTWRGYSLFDRTVGLTSETKYQPNTKYKPFLTPKNENGELRKLSEKDVFNVYRDEFDELVNTSSPRYDSYFASLKGTDQWRPIAVETTRAIHIMTSDASKPKWIAANQWYTPSSGNYVPFLLINNAMQSIDGEYGYYPERFEFDENCSSVLFRELNKLAWLDRTHYGLPLHEFWSAFETVYNTQMQQVIDDASKLTSIANAKDIVTNFNKHVRDIYVSQVKKTKNDLMWHIMDLPQTGKETFVPLIDLETYVKNLGWSNYNFDGTKVTFERGNVKATVTLSDGAYGSKGKITLNDSTQYDIKDSVENNKVYVDMATLNKAIAGLSEIATININDYLSKSFNHLIWIIPTTIVVAAGIGVGTYFLIKRRKNNKVIAPAQF